MSEVVAAVNARCEDRVETPADEPLFLRVEPLRQPADRSPRDWR
jgi:hypothetical protein